MTVPIAGAPDTRPTPRNRGFWPLRDIPTMLWLLLVVAAIGVHRSLPVASWLILHLVLLGAVTHAILVWSQHFSYALLRTAPTYRDRRGQSWRLALANCGAALVMTGVVIDVWPLTLIGAAALIVGVAWHGISMYVRLRRALPGRFGHTIRYYLLAAAMLSIGAALGAWLARGDGGPNLALAHATLNVLGWVGITVAGTLITLWPTILRTRVDDGAARGGARALPAVGVGVVIAAVGAAVDQPLVFTLGLVGYAAGLAVIMTSLWRAAASKPPRTFAALSVGAALLWWIGAVVVLVVAGVRATSGGDIAQVRDLVHSVSAYLAAGFAAQVLLGALSYLLPVALGGGPSAVRTGTAAFDRAASLRVAVANVALIVCALPVSSLIRVVSSLLCFLALASFLPISIVAVRAQIRAKRAGTQLTESRRGPIVPEGERPPGQRAGQAVAGLVTVLLAVAVTAALDPFGLRADTQAHADPDAPVQVVAVTAADMRFSPDHIDVPAGTHLQIELTNTDDVHVHDLALDNGTAAPRLSPGESATIDVGVVSADIEGWCTIVGHRQAGMTLQITVTDAPDSASHGDEPTTHDHTTGKLDMDDDATPGPGFTPYDAAVPELPPAPGPVTREVTLTVTDEQLEVAPGVRQTLWVYNGTAPGPILHGRVGDTFVVTLINDATMGHSIDFHAGALAPDEPMRTIAPGERLTYTFTAERAGIWMYHCSTHPMSAHIANGMYGAVIIEPDDLAPVDHSYVLVQGEYYLGADGGEVDVDTLASGQPDLVTFNGYANQYDSEPLHAAAGDRVRIWVLDAGPERPSSFHVVGGQFDTVWSEGRYLIDHEVDTGAQALALQPAQGGFVELTFPEAGHYPFVSHLMLDAERGAHGIIEVTDPDAGSASDQS